MSLSSPRILNPPLSGWESRGSRLHTVHNWAPIDDLPVGPRETNWSAEVGLGESLRFLYSGTLAMKHNPGLLLRLAEQCDQWGGAEMIVISEGAGVAWLQQEAETGREEPAVP